jgi:hypothetical protein
LAFLSSSKSNALLFRIHGRIDAKGEDAVRQVFTEISMNNAF